MGLAFIVAFQVFHFVQDKSGLSVLSCIAGVYVGIRNGVVLPMLAIVAGAEIVRSVSSDIITNQHVLSLQVASSGNMRRIRYSGLLTALNSIFRELLNAEIEEAVSWHVKLKVLRFFLIGFDVEDLVTCVVVVLSY